MRAALGHARLHWLWGGGMPPGWGLLGARLCPLPAGRVAAPAAWGVGWALVPRGSQKGKREVSGGPGRLGSSADSVSCPWPKPWGPRGALRGGLEFPPPVTEPGDPQSLLSLWLCHSGVLSSCSSSNLSSPWVAMVTTLCDSNPPTAQGPSRQVLCALTSLNPSTPAGRVA